MSRSSSWSSYSRRRYSRSSSPISHCNSGLRRRRRDRSPPPHIRSSYQYHIPPPIGNILNTYVLCASFLVHSRRGCSPALRHHKSQSPTPKHCRRHRSKSSSLSSPPKSPSPSLTLIEHKKANEKVQKEEEERKRSKIERREELDKMVEENHRRVEESKRREALEFQRKEEE
ncbi:Hypothetical predicted protein [Olea europaea subsp. europaea]|uniref:Uncharacterized protein n=1 Tax=Olea europaea subsp. europaea TaxID=158383 RepID=A0A8S0V0X7_OLEEU|nr:Hypothetical predicted protein [Olea europaea subsp. europaea]